MKTGAICNRAAAQCIHQSQGITTYDPLAKAGESNHWLLVWYNFSPDLATALHQATWVAFTGIASYNLVLWTMPIELIGSFLVYGFQALFGGLRNRWLVYAICGGVIVVRNDPLPVAGSYFLLDFVSGMALCDLWVCNQRTWRKPLSLAPALGLACLGFFAVKVKPLAAVIVVGATAASPRLQQLLGAPWLAFLGRLSFGVYLVHMMILCSLGCGTYNLLCGHLGWHHLTGSLTAALATLLGTILAGWAFYHLVDRPTIALTHRLDSWLFRPNVDNSASPPTTLPFAHGPRAA